MTVRPDAASVFSIPGSGTPFGEAAASSFPAKTPGVRYSGTANPSESVSSEDIPEHLLKGEPSMRELQDRYFILTYKRLHGRVDGENGIAKILGLSRSAVYLWIRRLKLRP